MSIERQAQIRFECDNIANLLVEKNRAYGNSALDPVRIFSNASNVEQLLVRIDDKLSRIQRGSEYGDEDTITDLIGYLILLKIALKEGEGKWSTSNTWPGGKIGYLGD